jgi:outer membrane lipoprotein-sorting protein
MIGRVLGIVLLIGIAFCVAAPAQTADELIKKNMDAKGGLEKLKAIKSQKASIKLSTQGIESSGTVSAKRPNSVRVEFTIQGKQLVQAYDGETGWQINPFQGSSEPEKLSGEELKDVQEEADLDGPLVDYKQKGHSVELIGKEDLEGTPVYKLKVTMKDGDVKYVYLDAENYLELKTTSKRKTPGGEVEIDSYFGNYKPVGGLMVAHSIENKVKSQTISTITVESVELNARIDDSIFKMPAKTEEKKPEDKPKTIEKPPSLL